ncbi:histone deacetylase superfamily [Rubrobacter xylanophilus DSM 9941]|uniref:Histone deacetylase superfamily n=1 Tax=Rubrobacter xylanophilus (strain DSM 9941 / JCM 11954 / NBRC 16129 / PRD-1) TaxID=266117 RepID=Q1AYS6_RUBXD|nr:histone deacetylase [Rubrobacter xylanophilus]ABG03452.1 histone deacetylase superfamily [Rubrobacter xylanophilus DSM 9941]
MLVYTHPACRKHLNPSSGVEVPERYPAALAGAEAAARDGAPVEVRRSEPAPEAALLAVHERGYLKLLRELSSSGGGVLDPDTALGPGSWEAALLAAGAAAGAAEAALSGAASFALVRPPGHHAGRGRAMGFCLINNAAVAAAHARALGARRVAVLDWDVHHGNGTQEIFYAAGDVLYLSVHRGGLFYPGTGHPEEVGAGPGKGFTVNVPLPAGSGEGGYAAAFGGVLLPVLEEFAPELVVVSAGYDAHASDPLGGMRLEAGSFGRFAAAVASLARRASGTPPAFVLEGGYEAGALTACVAATIRGAGEGETGGEPWPAEGRGDLLGPPRRALAPYWESLRGG